MSKTVVWDNGGNTIKVGYSTDYSPRIIPNCIIKAKNERKRIYIGDEIKDCRDHSGLFFSLPAERGYIVNWDTEQKVWDRVMCEDVLNLDPSDVKLVLTDQIYNVPAIKDFSLEILFEKYLFNAVAKTSASTLIALAHHQTKRKEYCCVVLDSGYSFTHIIPYFMGKAIRSAIVRIDIGGKALTNLLKEWISYRQLNVLEETFIMNECKEDCCYVADDFVSHVNLANQKSSSPILREYILPDFVTYHRGFLAGSSDQRDSIASNQKLTLNVERFAVPEVLFNPSDIGIKQMGICEALSYSVNCCPYEMRGRMLKNIFLVGGNARFDGYQKRIDTELRQYVDSIYDISFINIADPITHAWTCGQSLVNNGAIDDRFVTVVEYNEKGAELCHGRYFKFFELQN